MYCTVCTVGGGLYRGGWVAVPGGNLFWLQTDKTTKLRNFFFTKWLDGIHETFLIPLLLACNACRILTIKRKFGDLNQC